MDVVETGAHELERRFAVTLPATEVEARIERRLQELVPTLRLPGFRPGKVPPAIARERYGASVADEVTRALARESAQQVLTDRGLQPITPPGIEVAPRKAGEDLRYTLTVLQMPPIPAVDAAALQIDRPVVEDGGDTSEQRLRQLARASMKRQLLDRLAETSTFAVPPSLVTHELQAIERAVAAQLQRDSTTPAPDADALRALAERRVRLGLLVADVGRRHQLQETGAALEDRVVDLLLDGARITERRMSLRDLTASVED